MSDVSSYISLGIDVTNDKADLNEMFKDWPTDRTVVLRICRPQPEVESLIPGWLVPYANNELVEGAVVEELFPLYLEQPEGGRYQIRYKGEVPAHPTAEIFVAEDTFWDLAARTSTLYTSFVQGKPMHIKSAGGVELRDLAHMDMILSAIHSSLLKQGVNVAEIAR